MNHSAQARWLKTVEVFQGQGESAQLKLFPSQAEVPADDPEVARVLVKRVRLERTRQFGACWLGWELWKRLDRFFEQAADRESADVPWSLVAAVLAITRLCAPGSELAVEQRWYPSTALGDLLAIEEGKINDTRLYRCLDRNETFDGNRADVSTMESILRMVERKYGKARRIWKMDRGIVSEENLQAIRNRGGQYLVGTPRSQMKRFEAE